MFKSNIIENNSEFQLYFYDCKNENKFINVIVTGKWLDLNGFPHLDESSSTYIVRGKRKRGFEGFELPKYREKFQK